MTPSTATHERVALPWPLALSQLQIAAACPNTLFVPEYTREKRTQTRYTNKQLGVLFVQYVRNNPGVRRAQIVQMFNVTDNRATDILVQESYGPNAALRRSVDHRYYVNGV